MQVLGVGEHRVRLRLQEVHVPDVQHAHQQRHVLGRRGGAEVLIHRVEAIQQLLEGVRPQHGRQHRTDRGVHRVAAAHPVPEPEGVVGIDAEGLDLVQRRGDGDEVLGYGLLLLLCGEARVLPQGAQQPLPHQAGVGEGLLRGEGLRRDDHQGGLGIEILRGGVGVGGVDVGDEAGLETVLGQGLQRLVDHHRPEIAAADADVQHGLDPLAGHAGPLTGADLVREVVDAVQRASHVLIDVLAIHHEGRGGARRAAQRGVEHGAVLGGVDVGTGEHRVAPLLDTHLACQPQQQLRGFGRDQVLGQIDVQIGRGVREALRTLRIGVEPLTQGTVEGEVVSLELGPGVGGGRVDGGGG